MKARSPARHLRAVRWLLWGDPTQKRRVRQELARFCASRFGDFPLGEIADRPFRFVHLDVDLYRPTLDSLAFFYPRVRAGGVVVCDDYGFVTCPGAKRAVDEFMADKPEPVLHLPTGQGVIVRRSARR